MQKDNHPDKLNATNKSFKVNMFCTNLHALACGMPKPDPPNGKIEAFIGITRVFFQLLDLVIPITALVIGILGVLNIFPFSSALSYSMITGGSILLVNLGLIQINGFCSPTALVPYHDSIHYLNREYLTFCS